MGGCLDIFRHNDPNDSASMELLKRADFSIKDHEESIEDIRIKLAKVKSDIGAWKREHGHEQPPTSEAMDKLRDIMTRKKTHMQLLTKATLLKNQLENVKRPIQAVQENMKMIKMFGDTSQIINTMTIDSEKAAEILEGHGEALSKVTDFNREVESGIMAITVDNTDHLYDNEDTTDTDVEKMMQEVMADNKYETQEADLSIKLNQSGKVSLIKPKTKPNTGYIEASNEEIYDLDNDDEEHNHKKKVNDDTDNVHNLVSGVCTA